MPPTDRHNVVHIPRATWLGLVALLIAPWAVVVFVLRREPAAPTQPGVPARAVAAATAPATQAARARPGPWGDLEYSRILIEPPEEFILADYTKPGPFIWNFKGYAESALAALWQSAGLDAEQRRILDDQTRRTVTNEVIVIHPTRELILGLSPAARAAIYNVLAEFPENSSQHDSFRMRIDAVPEWFNDSGLEPAIITLTQRLLYRRGIDAMFFSDEDIVLSMLASPTDRIKYLKTLARKSCLLLLLRVHQGADIEEAARYWGHGRHTKDLRPLLQSLTRRPGGGTIDIVHLLPRFARSLLYTYPLPSENPSETGRDCHWSSLNFFSDQPDDRFSNPEFVRQALLTDYYPVAGAPMFGDIVMLVRPDGKAVHSCVFLADNFVFTKNGPAFSVPWQIATLEGVTSIYSLGTLLEIRRYRSKNQ